MIQIKGLVKFPITLDSTTWIFDDRKVKIEDIESGVFEGTKPIKFEDNREWNRAILEGQTNPPTLNSEIKYRKRSVLEDSFAINMTPFFKMQNHKTMRLQLNYLMKMMPLKCQLTCYLICSSNLRKTVNECMMITLALFITQMRKITRMNLNMLRI